MRYRLMASYLGASYQAAVGPSDRDVTLFAAPPPPEEHGFSPDPGGIWRRQVRLNELDALWESRPIGSYHGEPCLVLDDLGDRLHIVYLGMDERRAAQLGYWEVDRGVFEVVVPRYEVTDLAEERHEFPIALLLSTLSAAAPRALGSGEPVRGGNGAGGQGGPGPGGMAEWSAPAGAQQRVRGQLPAGGPAPVKAAQLPAAMSAPPAPASVQQQVTGAYQSPAGIALNGVAQPSAPGMPGVPNAQGAELGQLPGGQFAAAAPGQNAHGVPGIQQAAGAGLLSAPTGQLPPGGQLPAARPPAPQQFAPLPSLPAAPQAAAAPPPAALPQAAPPQPGNAQGTQAAQAPQAPQAPTTMAAWHGSPAADGSGTWYFQPAADAQQQNGVTATGYAPGGLTPNGYGQQDHGTGQPPVPNGFGGMQQYAQPAPMTGYPQAPALPPATATPQPGQPPQPSQPPQPGMPAQNGQPPQAVQFPQAAQPAQAMRRPPFAVSSAAASASAPVVSPAPPAFPAPLPPAPAAAPAGTAETAVRGAPAANSAALPAAGLPAAGLPAAGLPAAGLPAQQAPAASLGAPAATPQNAQAGSITAPLPVPAPVPPPLVTPQEQGAQQSAAPQPAATQATTAAPSEASATGPLPSSATQADQGTHSGLTAAGALSKLTGVVRGRRAARKPRLAMSAIFADLVDMADIPRSAYAVDEEVTGAMCLFKTDGGYEVFSCGEEARTEVRFFEEEEAAYFYLFGVLAAEALRNGRLSPRRN